MNIAIFSDTFIPDINGVATSVNSLFNLLRKNRHNVYLVTTSQASEISFIDNVLRIPGFDMKKLYGYRAVLPFNKEAFDILKSLNLDIVHINTEFGVGMLGFSFASKFNLPSVYTYHTMYEDYTYYFTKGYFDRFSKWAIREFCKTNLGRATEIISPSAKTEVYIRSIGVEKYVNIVPTGFDFTPFEKIDNREKVVKEIKEKYDLVDKYILLCIGRVAKEKSFDVLISAYQKFIETYKDEKTVMLFVGGGPELENLKKLAKTLKIADRIRFIGKVPLEDIPKYYAVGDLFLNASITETQGLTFMESMASRIPILCRYDNNLINVIENMVTGYYFVDENDFKDKLNAIMNYDRKDIEIVIENAFASIYCFSDVNFYNNIIGVYKRAIRKSW